MALTQTDILALLKTMVPADYIETLKPSRLSLYMTAGGVGTYNVDEVVANAGGVQWRVWNWDSASLKLIVTPITRPVTQYVAGDIITGPLGVWTVQSISGFLESGPGYELYQAIAKMLERVATAGEISANSLYIADAVGAGYAEGEIAVTRTAHAANDPRIVYYAGTTFSTWKSILRPGDWYDKLALNDYELLADLVFLPGETGPKTAQVRSVKYGYQQNVAAGTVTYPHDTIPEVAPSYLMVLGGVVGIYQKNEIVEGQTNGARFRVYEWNAANATLVLVPVGTNIQVDVGEVLLGEITGATGSLLASYRYLDEFNALIVTNAAAMTGGTWPSLDAVGDERGMSRQTGDHDLETFTMRAGGAGDFLIGERIEGRYRRVYFSSGGAGDYVPAELVTGSVSGAQWRAMEWNPVDLWLDVTDDNAMELQVGDVLTGAAASWEIAAMDPVVGTIWVVRRWTPATRELQVSASIVGPRIVAWEQVYGAMTGATWIVDRSNAYVPGGSESDDNYRDRLQQALDCVSKPALIRRALRMLVPLGYRAVELIEAEDIGCFFTETGDPSWRRFYMDAGGVGAYTIGELVIGGTSDAIWRVVLWNSINRELDLSYVKPVMIHMLAGAGAYIVGETVTGSVSGASGEVLSWDPVGQNLRIIINSGPNFLEGGVESCVGGFATWDVGTAVYQAIDIADGELLTGLSSGAFWTVNHRESLAYQRLDVRAFIAWADTDVDPDLDGIRLYGPDYDLTGHVILDNGEMRGMFVLVVPHVLEQYAGVYPQIYWETMKSKAAGVLLAAMYRDPTLNTAVTTVSLTPPA